jgi:hypothetical protein
MTEAESPQAALRHLVIVQRGRQGVFDRFTTTAGPNVTVVWDRRYGERRKRRPGRGGARRRDRRQRPLADTWDTLGFVVVRHPEESA